RGERLRDRPCHAEERLTVAPLHLTPGEIHEELPVRRRGEPLGLVRECSRQSNTNSFRHDASSAIGACSLFTRMKFSRTSTSMLVRMKHRNASSGVHTIGSPRTLNDVFTITGQPVRRSNPSMMS